MDIFEAVRAYESGEVGVHYMPTSTPTAIDIQITDRCERDFNTLRSALCEIASGHIQGAKGFSAETAKARARKALSAIGETWWGVKP